MSEAAKTIKVTPMAKSKFLIQGYIGEKIEHVLTGSKGELPSLIGKMKEMLPGAILTA